MELDVIANRTRKRKSLQGQHEQGTKIQKSIAKRPVLCQVNENRVEETEQIESAQTVEEVENGRESGNERETVGAEENENPVEETEQIEREQTVEGVENGRENLNEGETVETEVNAQIVNAQAIQVDQPAAAIWEYTQTFANKNEFAAFLRDEKCWSLLKTQYLQKGTKVVYRCNRVKRRGKQCNAGVYTLECSDGENAIIKLYSKIAEHSCNGSENKVTAKIGEDVKNFILEQYKLGNPPATIIFKLREKKDIEQPSKEQVTHIINYYKEKLPKSDVSIAQLKEFVESNNALPENEDDPFVVNFSCSPPRTPNEEKYFRIFVSTKRLLKHATESKILHADGTYKVVVQGFPILPVGISDQDKHFHLCGIAITSSESANDFEFLFDSLQHGVAKATNSDLKPEKLVADLAIPITNGFDRSFEIDYTRIYCFAHVMMNVEKFNFNDIANKEPIKNDLRTLQLMSNKQWFDIGWKLFARKWKEDEPEFVDYFEKVYIKMNYNWYEGCADRTPKTNNCLETFNRLMKQQQTMHLRKPLNQFLPQALMIVRERSKAYILDKAPPTKQVTISDQLKLKAWNYSQSAKTLVHEKANDGELHFYVFAGENMDKICLNDVRKFEKSKFKNFDDFAAKAFIIYKMSFSELNDWPNAKCTCVSYSKNNMCKHILMVAYRLCDLNPPDELLEHVETPLPKKNPRGRPKKTKLIIFVLFYIFHSFVFHLFIFSCFFKIK